MIIIALSNIRKQSMMNNSESSLNCSETRKDSRLISRNTLTNKRQLRTSQTSPQSPSLKFKIALPAISSSLCACRPS